MSKPFDNVTRFLHALDAKAWTRFLGIQAKSIELCDTDLSTVASQADSLLLIDKCWALHFENETSYKRGTSRRTFEYNVLADKALNVPVRSVLFLLRKEADGPAANGLYERTVPGGTKHIEFRYDVVRVWEIPPEKFFECGLGVLPLAFVADIDSAGLPALVRRTQSRLERETNSKTAAEIWTAIDVLLGLKFEHEQIEHIPERSSSNAGFSYLSGNRRTGQEGRQGR